MNYFLLVLILGSLLVIINTFRIMREYERAVVFLLGRFYKIKRPGLIIIIPVVQQMVIDPHLQIPAVTIQLFFQREPFA